MQVAILAVTQAVMVEPLETQEAAAMAMPMPWGSRMLAKTASPARQASRPRLAKQLRNSWRNARNCQPNSANSCPQARICKLLEGASLGAAIKALRPEVNATTETKNAQRQANRDLAEPQ